MSVFGCIIYLLVYTLLLKTQPEFQGHSCAEDCGGSVGWENLKAVFKKRGDPDGLKDWYRNICPNGERRGFDPWKWSINDVNGKLYGFEW